MEQAEKLRSVKKTWIPQKERHWVILSFIVAALIIVTGLWKMFSVLPSDLQTRSFKHVFQNYGSLARLALFFVLANYALLFILQKRLIDQWNFIKKGAISLSRFVRRWHTSIAIIAIGLIILHTVGAFMYGFKLDFSNISGLLALLVLLPVPISGLFRYKRLDRKWHLRSGLAFAVLFLIHAFI